MYSFTKCILYGPSTLVKKCGESPFLSRYCLADDSLLEAVKFLDLGDGAGWELLQVSLWLSNYDS